MKNAPQDSSEQNQRTVEEVELNAEDRMDKALADLQHAVARIRTGRASLSMLDEVRVNYYGTPTPLNQMAKLHVADPTLITIQPWDNSQIREIEKAILSANLGLNPSNDGKIVRVPIPPLTGERRQELVKKLHQTGEEHKVAVRNIRRDANDQLKKLLKDKAISEDAERRALDDIQKTTDAHILKVDELVKAKELEILEV
jgi:ribosome recycling factor